MKYLKLYQSVGWLVTQWGLLFWLNYLVTPAPFVQMVLIPVLLLLTLVPLIWAEQRRCRIEP